MYVLDTNTLLHFFRGDGHVAHRLLATSPADVALPSVVVYELETGLAKSSDPVKRRGQFDQLLQVVAVLPFGIEEAKAAAGSAGAGRHADRPDGHADRRDGPGIEGCW